MIRAPGLLAGALLAAACARASSAAPDGGAASSVLLERRPCFGTCPVYTVTVDGSGSVRFEGRRFVADSGTSTATVPKARLDSLLAELESAGYFGFAERYGMDQAGCGRYATDLPTVVTEVRIHGRVKRVEHDHGCADAPEMLDSLERRIDEVAGVSRWVGR